MSEQKMIRRGKLLIDWRYHTVFWKNHQVISLNEKEKALLYLLAGSSKQVVSYENIFEWLWGKPYGEGSDNIIWCFVRRFRNKMKKVDPEAEENIKNVRRVKCYLDTNTYDE